jgi:hypothetical protein
MSLLLLLALSRVGQDPTPEPPLSQPVPWVVVEHDANPGISGWMTGQQLVRFEDGAYVAIFGHPGPSVDRTSVFRSRDRGRTWSSVAELEMTICTSLFVKGKALYLVGVDAPRERKGTGLLIRRSLDQGETWTTEILRDDLRYATPISMVEHGGRFWRPFLSRQPGDRRDSVTVGSAPVDSELWRADAWRWSEKLVLPTDGPWYWSCMISDGGAAPVLLVRAVVGSIGPVVDPSPDGSTLALRKDPPKWTNCEHALGSELTRDPRTGSYFVVRGAISETATSKHARVELVSSANLIDWESRSTLLVASGSNLPVFQGGAWLIEDEDLLVFQSVWSHTAFCYPETKQSESILGMAQGTAWIFYRVPKFRDRKPDDPPLWGPPPPK